ncbi:MAG: alpha/beta fold hydrolase [Acidimicrobiales bacterium]
MTPATDPVAAAVGAWEAGGTYRELAVGEPRRRRRFFTVDRPASRSETFEPLVVIHGFPTSSFDFHLVIDDLSRHRRVLLIDLLGYGLSDKPDLAYTVDVQADAVAAFVAELGVSELAMLTHDLGDTVGGELLARQMEGRWPVTVTRRVVTNGSIYIDMAHLSAGQELLLSLPDVRLGADAPIDAAGMVASLSATFSPEHRVAPQELDALWAMVARGDGHRNLPRLIRYIEERRRRERRFTGAIEDHPSPLAVVWGVDDPIAVAPMADELCRRRPDAPLTRLEGVGHYPMIEAPGRFTAALAPLLR